MSIAALHLVGRVEWLLILVADTDRLAEVIHDILFGGRHSSADRFLADWVGPLPVGIQVLGGYSRRGAWVSQFSEELLRAWTETGPVSICSTSLEIVLGREPFVEPGVGYPFLSS